MKKLPLSALATLLLTITNTALGICCETPLGLCCGPGCKEQCYALSAPQVANREAVTFNLSKSGTRFDDEGFGTESCKPLRLELEEKLSVNARQRCAGDFNLVRAHFSCRRPKMSGTPLEYVQGDLSWTASCTQKVQENEEGVGTDLLDAEVSGARTN